jgi:hypothetical protein
MHSSIVNFIHYERTYKSNAGPDDDVNTLSGNWVNGSGGIIINGIFNIYASY